MKRMHGILAAVAISAAVVLTGCDPHHQHKVDWQQQKQEAVQETDKRIDQIQKNLADLKLRAEELGDKAKAKYEEVSAEMQPEIDKLKQRASQLKNSAEQEWGEIKVNLNEALDTLQKKYEQLKTDLSPSQPASSS